MFRFFLDSKIEDPQNIVIRDRDIIKKVTKVLRYQIGDVFTIFDNEANEYEVAIKTIFKNELSCQFVNKSFVSRELDLEINLYQALIKPDKFELVLQKVTEIGVKNIIPIITEYGVLKELATNKQQRWQKIIAEATMQCGGKRPPTLSPVLSYEQAIKALNTRHCNLIAYEQEQETKLQTVLVKDKPINVFIGPEGGFSAQEIDSAKRYSVTPFSLGKRILRAETAAIVACGLIANF